MGNLLQGFFFNCEIYLVNTVQVLDFNNSNESNVYIISCRLFSLQNTKLTCCKVWIKTRLIQANNFQNAAILVFFMILGCAFYHLTNISLLFN